MEKKLKCETPSVPNFIKVGGEMISIKLFTEKELKQIGREWTLKLIKKAKGGVV